MVDTNEVLRLEYNSAISDLHEINSSFDRGVLRICYTGANRNKTYFSKATLERSIPTMYNCPIVAHYFRDGTLGGHDVEVITDYDNQLRLVNLTQPVGIIPESAKVYFENVEEDDGTVHEYLCAEVILWKRQEAYKAIKENGVTAESMEITVKDGDKVDDVYVVNDFEFTAFALLGDCEPCFESAALQMSFADFSQEFKSEFSEMMREFKEFNLQAASEEVSDTNSYKKGGCRLEDEKILETFEEKEEVVDEVLVEESVDVEYTHEDVDDATEEVNEDYALNSNLKDSIFAAFADKTISTEWGEVEQYYIVDYDTEANMVYAWDTADWLLYGFAYSMNGDFVAVDFDSKKRMKYVIAEFDEGDTQDSPFASAFTKMTESMKKANEDISDIESKFTTVSEQIKEMDTELNNLRQFKSSVEAASDQAQRDELLAQFADLGDVDEFVALVADSSAYELDALEEKCYAIRGRNMKMNFSNKDAKAPKLPARLEDKVDDNEPYGGLVRKYLKKD